MAEDALGWLGWSEEQAMRADVNTIQVAMRGRVRMLKAIFGSGEDEDAPTAKKSKAEMAGRLKAATRAHNEKLAKKDAAKRKHGMRAPVRQTPTGARG